MEFNGLHLLILILVLTCAAFTAVWAYRRGSETGAQAQYELNVKELDRAHQDFEEALQYHYLPVTVWVYESLSAGLPSRTQECSSIREALDFASQYDTHNVTFTISHEDNKLTLVIK